MLYILMSVASPPFFDFLLIRDLYNKQLKKGPRRKKSKKPGQRICRERKHRGGRALCRSSVFTYATACFFCRICAFHVPYMRVTCMSVSCQGG